MFDFLDVEKVRDNNFLEGNYYVKKPKKPEDHAVLFFYSMVDPESTEYGKVMGELRSDPSRTAIRTNEDCGWLVGAYVSTQDGFFWGIEQVIKEVQNDRNQEALRVVRQAADTDYILRLGIRDNPWGWK